jgi:tRNA 2-thiouridine synthesizing protein A
MEAAVLGAADRLSTAAMAETHLNLRGLKCPLPALKTRKALAGLRAGDLLVVSCTDPLAAIDIPNLVTETKDVIEDQAQAEGALVFRIRRAARA